MRITRNPIYNRIGGLRRVVTTPLHWPGYRNRFNSGPPVYCPDEGREIAFVCCLHCSRYARWHSSDEVKRCWHEFKALESRGYYDEEKWLSHLETTDPETFERIQEEKRINAEFAADFEREKAEMARLAEKLARDDDDGEGKEDGEEPDRADEDEDEC